MPNNLDIKHKLFNGKIFFKKKKKKKKEKKKNVGLH